MATFVEQIVAELSAALRARLLTAVEGQVASRVKRFDFAGLGTTRRATQRKRRKLDMRCRYPACPNRSKGPRFHFMCEKHIRLPRRKQLAALHASKAKRSA